MSRKSLVQVLFQEIVENIIDYLKDDRKSLLACAQTCRGFLPRAQSYIFRSVSLASPYLDERRSWEYGNSPIVPKSRVESLYDIVQARPELPCNIRVLTVEVTTDDYGAWLSRDIHFSHIMSLLAHSTDLFPAISILGDNIGDDDVCYSLDQEYLPNIQFPYHPEFMPRFWAPLVAPFITKLDLFNLEEVPIGILLTCPKLRSLRMDNVSINVEKTFGASVQGCQSPLLETLEFYQSSKAVDKIFGLSNSDGPHLDASLLRSLDVSPKKWYPIECLPQLMWATRSSLEDLVIDNMDCHPQLSIFFDLSKLPTLRTIHVKCALYNIYYSHPFDCISELLNSSGQSTMLEKLEVVTTIDPWLSLIGPEWWEADHPGWAQLDTALDRLTSLSGFRRLRVLLHFVRLERKGAGRHNLHWGQEWEAQVNTLDRDRLPLAHGNPGVSFVCSFDTRTTA